MSIKLSNTLCICLNLLNGAACVLYITICISLLHSQPVALVYFIALLMYVIALLYSRPVAKGIFLQLNHESKNANWMKQPEYKRHRRRMKDRNSMNNFWNSLEMYLVHLELHRKHPVRATLNLPRLCADQGLAEHKMLQLPCGWLEKSTNQHL